MLLRRWTPPGLATSLNWWCLNIALPALVLDVLPRLQLHANLWLLVAPQWLLYAVTFAALALIGRLCGWSRSRIGGLTLVAGLSNTALFGYPALEALRGKEGLALGAIADQFGSFIALAVGGALTVAVYAGAPARPALIARRIVLFPPFLALLAGLAAGSRGGWTAPVSAVLERIGATLSPLALFAVALRVEARLHAGQIAATSVVLVWKLLLMPALALALCRVAGAGGLILAVSVLQTAMPPMFTAAIVADQHGLDPPLVHAATGLGMLLGLATVIGWNAALT